MALKEQKSSSAVNSLNVFLNKNVKMLRLAIFILVLLLTYFFLLQPKITDLRQEKAVLATKKVEELAGLQKYYLSLQELEAVVNNFKVNKAQSFERLAQILPSEAEVPNLIAQLEALTQASGFRLTAITFAEAQAAKTTSKKSTKSTGSEETPTKIKEEAFIPELDPAVHVINISMKVSGGGYLELKKLLDNIEKHLRIFDVNSIGFSSAEGENSYNIPLQTYYYSP